MTVPLDAFGSDSGADLQRRILVVGGGPAGATTSLLLARNGWDVTLVDRSTFPRGKACGECLNPGGVALLAEFGLLDRVLEAGATPLTGWDLSTQKGSPAQGYFAPEDRGLGIERRTFDHTLLEAAKEAGVEVREGVQVVKVGSGDGRTPARARIRLRRGAEVVEEARFVVGADGLGSRVASASGIHRPVRPPRRASLSWRIQGWGPPRDRGRLILGEGYTVGVAPVGPPSGSLWNATLVVAGEAARKELSARGWDRLQERMESARIPWNTPPEKIDGPWGSGSFHRPVSSATRNRVVLVGDAAGYFDPLTGQGIYRALKSAQLLAELLGPKSHVHPGRALSPVDLALLGLHGPRLDRAVRSGRRLQKTIDVVLSGRLSRRAALASLRAIPSVASGLIRLTGDRVPFPEGRVASTAPTLPLEHPIL